jgi:hypothetical protein
VSDQLTGKRTGTDLSVGATIVGISNKNVDFTASTIGDIFYFKVRDVAFRQLLNEVHNIQFFLRFLRISFSELLAELSFQSPTLCLFSLR